MTATTLVPVSIDLLDPAEDNPRHDLGELTELALSITEVGILQPIVVAQSAGERYTIIAGHRRHAAARIAGLTEVEVIVQAVDDDADRGRMMLIENLHREDLTALDKARGFKALADSGLSQRDIAARVGISQATVSKHISLLKLPEPALALVANGELSQEDAVTLVGLPADARKDIVTDIEDAAKAAEPMSGDEVARAVRRAKEEAEEDAALQKMIAGLKAEGVTFVEHSAVKYSPGKTGPISLSVMYWVKAAAHKKLPCRVVAVTVNGAIVEACGKPKDHPQPANRSASATKENPAVKAKWEEVERLRGLLAQAGERRLAWLKALPSTPALTVAANRLQVVCRLAYVDPPDLAELMGIDDATDQGFLAASTTESTARRMLFLGAALALESDFEDSYSPDFEAPSYKAKDAIPYLEALVELGYEASWIESKYLGLPYEEPQMPGTSSPATEEGASDAEACTDSGPSDEATEPVGDQAADPVSVGTDTEPVITIEEKKGKHHINCSICGYVGYNTKPDMAQERVRAHKAELHPRRVAA
jgi:ParB/RepB/Spo0J family partition protein